jgi:hypothetical protein
MQSAPKTEKHIFIGNLYLTNYRGRIVRRIFHFCNGYKVKEGRIYWDRLGCLDGCVTDIGWKTHKSYTCRVCGYKASPNERFAIKLLRFNSRE